MSDDTQDDTQNQHDSGASPTQERRPSHAESALSLLVSASRGVLSTLDRRDGSPYGSLVEYVQIDEGDAAFLLSDMAEHTANFKEDARASLFVSPGMADGRPLALERATLIGEISRVDGDGELREAYLRTHPQANVYVDFSDFAFWRINVQRVRYIGGFGRMSWIDRERWRAAGPDPLAEMAAGAIDHMNDDHPQALVDYAKAFCDVEDPARARMVGLDRFGFDMQVEDTSGREQRVRVHFDDPVEHPRDVRPTMVELVERARS
ncbi:MAG: HugZ family protein [Persicimonas sp.]